MVIINGMLFAIALRTDAVEAMSEHAAQNVCVHSTAARLAPATATNGEKTNKCPAIVDIPIGSERNRVVPAPAGANAVRSTNCRFVIVRSVSAVLTAHF